MERALEEQSSAAALGSSDVASKKAVTSEMSHSGSPQV